MSLFKNSKRLFAALLCLCMAVAVLPAAAPAASAAAGDVLTYNFTTAGMADGNWDTEYSGYNKSSYMDVGGINDSYISIQTNKNYADQAVGQWLAIKINVPTAGVYRVNMKSYIYTSGGTSDIYFMPATVTDIAAAVSGDSYYIGQVNYKDGEADTEVKRVNVPEGGDYYLVYKVAEGSAIHSNNIHYLYAAGAVLTWIADPVPADTLRYDFTSHPTIGQAAVAEKFDAVFSGNLQCGGSGASYLYLTSKEAAEDWVSIGLPGELEAGVYDANFVVYQYKSGTDLEAYLMPKSADAASSFTAEYYIGDISSYASSTVYTADYPAALDAVIKADGEYKLVLKTKAGVVTNHFWLQDFELTRKGDIVPVGTDGVKYGFTKANITDNWVLSSKSDSVKVTVNENFYQYYSANVGDYVALSLGGAYLEAGKTYALDMTAYQYKSGAVSDLYLIPASEDVAAAMTDKYYIGELDCWASTDVFDYKPELANYTAEKDGMYVLVAKISKVGVSASSYGNNNYCWIRDFTIAEYVEPEVTNFGSSYAYIRESFADGKASYDLVLVAAIDGLDYASVGFDYTIGGAAAVKTPAIINVYDELTLSDSTAANAKLSVTASDLGAEGGFVYYYVIEDIGEVDASTEITFNAYAESASGTVTGAAVTATVAK